MFEFGVTFATTDIVLLSLHVQLVPFVPICIVPLVSCVSLLFTAVLFILLQQLLLQLLLQLWLHPLLLFSNVFNILHISIVRYAVINDNIVYAIVATKKLATSTRNATTKNIANIILATIIGHLNTFCNTIENIITAIGSAK